MKESRLASLLFAAVTLSQPALAQTVFHARGPGELMPPNVLEGPSAGPVDADLTFADFLWAFHRDALLPEVVLPPIPAPVLARAVASLEAAVHTGPGEELRWQSLWAWARIARDDVAAAEKLHQRLLAKDLQLVGPFGETRLLANGLAARGNTALLDRLVKVATDPAAAARRRAFAYYGLGLAAQQSSDAKVQFQVLAAVENGLLVANAAPEIVRIAALHALALARLDVAPDLPAPALQLLDSAWTEPAPDGPLSFHAHVPIAVAALVRPDDAAAAEWRARFAATIADPPKALAMPRACTLALGALCQRWDDVASPGAEHGGVLQELAKTARDNQVQNYALFACGVAGGAHHRAFLKEQLGGPFPFRPWIALGLAAGDVKGKGEPELENVLAGLLARTKNPSLRPALAAAVRVVRREAPTDAAAAFQERHGRPLPGSGDAAARLELCATTLADTKASDAERTLAAVAIGHLADRGARHWSARLARAIDYRSANPVLLGLPNGVLRMP